MSERKVLNKYYPPDFDPSKIPRMKLAKNRQYTVRLMAPFNMRCATCGEYIYKGKKFNARKEDVENEDYLGIRIYRFYIKCTRCLQEISFKTDPQNTDYVIEAGATRNFMALKLAEEQALREENERKEEEANNPMKLLEIRTEQSRQEIELLESLEELKQLNRRQAEVDYDNMLQQCGSETTEQREQRQAREDDELIRAMKFQKSSVPKIVAEEIIEEITESEQPPSKVRLAESIASSTHRADTNKQESWRRSVGGLTGNLGALVRRKQAPRDTVTCDSTRSGGSTVTCNSIVKQDTTVTCETVTAAPSALALLAGYSDDDSDT